MDKRCALDEWCPGPEWRFSRLGRTSLGSYIWDKADGHTERRFVWRIFVPMSHWYHYWIEWMSASLPFEWQLSQSRQSERPGGTCQVKVRSSNQGKVKQLCISNHKPHKEGRTTIPWVGKVSWDEKRKLNSRHQISLRKSLLAHIIHTIKKLKITLLSTHWHINARPHFQLNLSNNFNPLIHWFPMSSRKK